MATGVRGKERFGQEAQIAAKPHSDPNPLPPPGLEARLEYEGKLPEHEVLRRPQTHFSEIAGPGHQIRPWDGRPNALILADNLFAMHHMLQNDQRPTLIYFDPPYGTGMEFQSRQLERAYKDELNSASYIEFLRRRLILMRELLSDDGSIYVHIGHQMVAHLKVLMDEIFGARNFRNLIIRRKCSSKNSTRNKYPNIHDYLLYYAKSPKAFFEPPKEQPSGEWLSKEYDKVDSRGQFKMVPVHAPGVRHGETGKPWRGVLPPPGKHWQYAPSKLDELDAAGEMHWSRNGNPRRKVYLTDDKMVALTDYWSRFRDAHHQSVQITGYPTEKNLDLLKVIVAASTRENDLVFDPFCGSGTAAHAADALNRRWIGVDESFVAIRAALRRLRHGLNAMGDYVSKSEAKENLLFDLPFKSENKTTSSIFKFVADAELLEAFEKEIISLASI